MKLHHAAIVVVLLLCAAIGAAHAQTNNYNILDHQGSGSTANPRVTTAADAVSITPNGDTSDIVIQTNTQVAGTLTINNPTGTPVAGQRLVVRVKCTNAQTLAFGNQFRFSTDIAQPAATTGTSKTDYLGFLYNAVDLKWDAVAKAFGY